MTSVKSVAKSADPDWISCAKAEKLVKAITEEPAEGADAFKSMLRLARYRHIRATAERAEVTFWRLGGLARSAGPLNLEDLSQPGNAADFFFEIERRYRSQNKYLSGHSCFLTGVFQFAERCEGIDGDDMISFEVIALRFSRSDILALFDPPPVSRFENKSSPAEVATAISTAKAEGDCREWLLQQFADDGTSHLPKEHLWRMATTMFAGRLSKRGFDRAWADATVDFPEKRAAGRKSKR